MKIFSEKIWKRHTNSLSAWTRIMVFFLIPIAVWFQNLYFIMGLLIFFTINPILFSEQKNKNNWMSKSILGEEL